MGYLAGVDYSNHQPKTYKPRKKSFGFILATDGHSWESPAYGDQRPILEKAVAVSGMYHWLRPGNINAQADWFVAQAKPKPGQLVAVDWEQAGTSNADKDALIKRLKKLLPKNRVGLYCNVNYWLNYDRTSYVGDFLWIAELDVIKPTIQHDWQFWQYKFGTTGPDLDWGNFPTKQALIDWANFAKPAPTPPPTVTTVPVYPSADAIRTPFGAWGSSWSWNWNGKQGQHGGDDWHRNAGMAEIGDPIYAVADGEIIYAGDARKDGGQGWGPAFGIHTLLKWDTGGRTSVDGHMSKLHVKTGQKVKAGDKIGEKGMTGNVTGPHVHHEDHLGTKWTDKRVKPIYPGIKTTDPEPTPAPAPIDQEDLDVAIEQPRKRRSKPVTVPPTKDGVQRTIPVDDNGGISWGLYSANHEADIYVRASGPDGATLLVMGAVVDYDSKGKVVNIHKDAAWTPVPTNIPHGYTRVHFRENVAPAKKGLYRRLQVLAHNATDKNITITDMIIKHWKAPYTK